MKKSDSLIIIFLTTIVLGFAGPAWAARIRVAQESAPGRGDFDANILGYIDPYPEREKAAAEFYSYEALSHYSFNGPHPRLRDDTSHLFLVTTREGLSLFIVHDKPNNPDGGGATMRIRVKGDPNGARILIFDDPNSEWDTFDAKPGGKEFLTWHRWFPCCTDGLVLGTLEGRWRVFLEFPAGDAAVGDEPFDGLQRWRAFSASGNIVELKLKKGRRVRLDPPGSL
ncbi:MAG: hypothetical protein HOL05_12130, partial [Nitrospinaceae bacterium]|nr:hypothetical protein [Nitrospinaceae bacterium]